MEVFVYSRKVEEAHKPEFNRLISGLIEKGATLLIHPFLQSYFEHQLSELSDSWRAVEVNSNFEHVKWAISIGGDGSLLETARMMELWQVPTLGINTGRLGFLTQVSLSIAPTLLDDIFLGQYHVEHRTFIDTHIPDNDDTVIPKALNEVAILGYPHNTMISVHVYVNDLFVATYWADGLMLATPTGSTAYSLSCGGPIVSPETGSFLITPIAPHNLNLRPLIIPDSAEVTFIPESRDGKFMVNIDGKSHYVQSGTKIKMTKSANSLRLIQLKDQHFYKIIRQKMGWGFDQRG
jgi:NAD+ kinase